MTLLRRATDQQQSEWNPVPEGLFRWIVGIPELKLSEKFGKYQARFPLMLTKAEQDRVKEEHGDPPEGIQQSWRANYYVGLSLGYVQRDGQYKSTKLIDFLAACLGHTNTKKFRAWVAAGGGPPAPEDKDDQKAELENIAEWLGWWENLEVYGTIAHAEDSQVAGQVWARWAGPMPIGSLPGQPDADYQALGRGKLRAMLAETEMAGQLVTVPAREAVTTAPAARTYTEVFEDGSEETPF